MAIASPSPFSVPCLVKLCQKQIHYERKQKDHSGSTVEQR